MTRIVAVLGSVTPPGRFSSAIAAAVARANGAGHEVELLDLANLCLDFADGRPAADHDDDSARIIELISNAEAVLLASPVYRGTYTGALKNLLDLMPIEALQGKPAGIVAMGASQHHFLGVDSHLRDVLAWFGALVAPTGVYLTSADFADGTLSDAASAQLDSLVGALASLAGAGLSGLGPSPFAAGRG